jgi:hypothetical protein
MSERWVKKVSFKVDALLHPSPSWRMWLFKAGKANSGHDLGHRLDLHGAKRLVQAPSQLFHASRVPGRDYGKFKRQALSA